jgi:putative spermidine/putrescine transport system permease protein
VKAGRISQWLGWAYVAAVTGFLLLPLVIMVPASFGAAESLEFPPREWSLRWYVQVLSDPSWLASAALSAKLALFAAVLATGLGLLLGVAQMRFARLKPGLRAFIMLPMVAPHIVLATGLFPVLLETRYLGSPTVLGLLHASLALPLTMVVFINAVDTIDPLLWTAASTLGARWWTILSRIILPNLVISALVAFVLAFIVSWDEVTFAVFIGPTLTPTLPSRMFSYLQELINPSLTAIATLLVAITLVAGLVALSADWLRARRLRALVGRS